VDLVHPTDNNEWVNLGLEYDMLNLLTLRAGYRLNVERGKFSFGAGVHPPAVGGIGLGVDYAYTHFDATMGAIQQFSLLVSF
jgi:hypothetical protein